MKRALVLLFAVVMALVVTLPAMAFFGFGYTHGVPDNDSKLWGGFEFGPTNSEFNVNAYLGDLWRESDHIGDGTSAKKSDTFLGVEAFYVGSADVLDIEVGSYIETAPLVTWPAPTLEKVGFYGDLTIHVLAGPPIMWDLFASFDLNVTSGTPALTAEVGFEVDICLIEDLLGTVVGDVRQ